MSRNLHIEIPTSGLNNRNQKSPRAESPKFCFSCTSSNSPNHSSPNQQRSSSPISSPRSCETCSPVTIISFKTFSDNGSAVLEKKLTPRIVWVRGPNVDLVDEIVQKFVEMGFKTLNLCKPFETIVQTLKARKESKHKSTRRKSLFQKEEFLSNLIEYLYESGPCDLAHLLNTNQDNLVIYGAFTSYQVELLTNANIPSIYAKDDSIAEKVVIASKSTLALKCIPEDIKEQLQFLLICVEQKQIDTLFAMSFDPPKITRHEKIIRKYKRYFKTKGIKIAYSIENE